eukprot:1157376-Pelagomonas_calceolata.AAC.12
MPVLSLSTVIAACRKEQGKLGSGNGPHQTVSGALPDQHPLMPVPSLSMDAACCKGSKKKSIKEQHIQLHFREITGRPCLTLQ